MINIEHIAQDLANETGARKVNAVSAIRQTLVAGVLVEVEDLAAAAMKKTELDDAHSLALAAVATEAQTKGGALLIEAKRRLRAELADPRYAGKKAQEIQEMLSTEVRNTRPRTSQEKVRAALVKFVEGPGGIIVGADDGQIADKAQVQAAIDEEMKSVEEVPIAVGEEGWGEPPPLMRIFSGLPYAANTVSDDDIAEALA